jgi:hypothetical protein
LRAVNLLLRTATAVALFLGATAASQQKPDDGKAAASQAPPSEQGAPKGEAPRTTKRTTEPKDKAGKRPETDNGAKGTAQGQTKDQPGKGTAQTESKDKGTKGTAKTEPTDKASKGTARQKEPSSAPKSSESTKSATPKDSTAGAPSTDQNENTASSGGRVQLSEQQRTTVPQTILKDKDVNRVTNLNFTINVGARVPRDLRLVTLPASVLSIVPGYRNHRYFVVNDQICIVDPDTYEIVEIINVPGQAAAREDRGGPARLVLSDDERMIILRAIDMRDGSTMGLGSLTEGADRLKGREFACDLSHTNTERAITTAQHMPERSERHRLLNSPALDDLHDGRSMSKYRKNQIGEAFRHLIRA